LSTNCRSDQIVVLVQSARILARSLAHDNGHAHLNCCPYQKVNLRADRHLPRRDLNAVPAADPLRRVADSDVVAHVVRIVVKAGADVNVSAGRDAYRPPPGVFRRRRTVPRHCGAARVQQVGAARSGRSAFVSMVEAADLRDRHDVAITGPHDRTGNRRVFI